MKRPRSALKIAEALECYRLKNAEELAHCQKKSCPYNNNDPEHGCWCCGNNLLFDAVCRLRYQDAKIKRLERRLDAVWTGRK